MSEQLNQMQAMLEQLVKMVGQNNAVTEELRQDNQAIRKELSQLSQAVTRIENTHGEKLSALFDAREVQMDVNERIVDSLGRIENKLDRMSLKVSSHDAILQRVK